MGDRGNTHGTILIGIDALEREICTCPWPADAFQTRHNLGCRLMEIEHTLLREKAKLTAQNLERT